MRSDKLVDSTTDSAPSDIGETFVLGFYLPEAAACGKQSFVTFIRFSPAVRGSFVPLRQPDIFRQPPLLMLIKYSGLKAAPEYGLIRRAAHAMMPAGRRAALLEIAYTYKRLAQKFY